MPIASKLTNPRISPWYEIPSSDNLILNFSLEMLGNCIDRYEAIMILLVQFNLAKHFLESAYLWKCFDCLN